MTPARFRWGMIFIFVGVFFLARNMNLIEWGLAWDFILYFPYFLIALGIEKIFTRSRLESISYLSTLAFVAGGLYLAFDNSRIARDYADGIDIDDSIEAIYATVNLGGGDLEIRDSRRGQIFYRFRDWVPRPRIKAKVNDDKLRVVFDSRQGKFWAGTVQIGFDEDDDWKLYFSRDIPLFLECNGDQSDLHLNFATTPLRSLKVLADEAEITVRVGVLEPLVTLQFRGADTKLTLRVPFESALRIRGLEDDAYLSRLGLKRVDDGYVNEGFESKNNLIEVDLDDGFSSLTIDFF